MSPGGIAMRMLQSRIDITVIFWWPRHKSPASTYQYVQADRTMKTRALGRLTAPAIMPRRYRAPDTLMAFLRTL